MTKFDIPEDKPKKQKFELPPDFPTRLDSSTLSDEEKLRIIAKARESVGEEKKQKKKKRIFSMLPFVWSDESIDRTSSWSMFWSISQDTLYGCSSMGSSTTM